MICHTATPSDSPSESDVMGFTNGDEIYIYIVADTLVGSTMVALVQTSDNPAKLWNQINGEF